jgi:hypothetical protein
MKIFVIIKKGKFVLFLVKIKFNFLKYLKLSNVL